MGKRISKLSGGIEDSEIHPCFYANLICGRGVIGNNWEKIWMNISTNILEQPATHVRKINLDDHKQKLTLSILKTYI